LTTPSNPDLIKVTEIFLIPNSFLVAALGTADTNMHRTFVSLLGLVISVLWLACSWEAVSEHKTSGADHTLRTRIFFGLSLVFVAGWFLSTIGHAVIWNRPLGT